MVTFKTTQRHAELTWMSGKESELNDVVERFKQGDHHALADLMAVHRNRLAHLIDLQMDSRLLGRVDADDVLQEIYIDAANRIEHFHQEHSGSVFVWLRLITLQTLANVHRRHLGTKMRDVSREMSLFHSNHNATSSLAMQLLGQLTSPSQVAMREESALKLESTIKQLSKTDQQILHLRHFEQLTNNEVAEVLGIQTKAASIRYIRALKRLKDALEETSDFTDN